MPTTERELSRAQARIVELEVRFTHQDEALRSLSDVIYEQQLELTRVLKRVEELEKKLLGAQEPVAPRNPEDEVPPHY